MITKRIYQIGETYHFIAMADPDSFHLRNIWDKESKYGVYSGVVKSLDPTYGESLCYVDAVALDGTSLGEIMLGQIGYIFNTRKEAVECLVKNVSNIIYDLSTLVEPYEEELSND